MSCNYPSAVTRRQMKHSGSIHQARLKTTKSSLQGSLVCFLAEEWQVPVVTLRGGMTR